MPYLNVKISSPNAQQIKERLALLLTDLTTSILGKKRELTAVAIESIEMNSWFISGESIKESGACSFYLDVKVTEGTITKNEKAEYVEKVFSGIEDIVGCLALASYIVIHEVRADSWGYQGQSQEFRYINGKKT